MEKSRWYYRSSNGRGSLERCCTRSKAGRALEGSAFYELRLELFYTQYQSLYFRVRISNEGSTEKFSQPKLPPLIFALDCFQIFWCLTRWCRSLFKSRRFEKIFSKFLLEHCSRYGVIMVLSAFSRLPW